MFWCYPGQQNACVSVEEEERESPRGAACVGLAERARPGRVRRRSAEVALVSARLRGAWGGGDSNLNHGQDTRANRV